MSTPQWNPSNSSQPQFYPQPTPPVHKRSKWIIYGLIAVALLLVGGCLGSLGSGDDTTAPSPVASSEPSVRTVTKTVTEEVTPQACRDFVQSSDRLVNLAADGYSIAAEMVDAAANQNVTKMNSLTAKLDKLSKKVVTARAQYDADKEECGSK